MGADTWPEGRCKDVKTKEEFCAAGPDRESDDTSEQEEVYCASPLLYWEDFIAGARAAEHLAAIAAYKQGWQAAGEHLAAIAKPLWVSKKVIVDWSMLNKHRVIFISVITEDSHVLTLACNPGWTGCTMPQAGETGDLIRVAATLYEGANVLVEWDDPATKTGRYCVTESR